MAYIVSKFHKDLLNILLMAHDETKKEFPEIFEMDMRIANKELFNYYENFWYPLMNEIPKIKKPVQLISKASKLRNDKITTTTFIHLVDYLLCY